MKLLHAVECGQCFPGETLFAENLDDRRHGGGADEGLIRTEEAPESREPVGLGQDPGHLPACERVVEEAATGFQPGVELQGLGDA